MALGNDSTQALKLLTQVKLTLGKWDEAEALAQQLKGVEGEEAMSAQVLGMVYQGREQSDESIDAFKRAHALAPDASRPVVALVQTYVKNGRTEEARQFLQKVLSENDKNATAVLLLGQLSLQENDVPAAVEYFNRLVTINPQLDVGYRSLAAIYIREGNFADAERVLLDGLTQIPASTALSVSLATVYQMQENFDRAIVVYEELLQKNPGLIVARNNLASLLTDYRDDQASSDRAVQMASEVRNSEVAQFRDTYSWANVQAGVNLEEAVVILGEIVRENENVGVYRYHLGEALRRKGDIENATLHLNKVIEMEDAESPVAAMARESLQLVSQ
jgi:tetratricopeptide (TPR) repeat protein